MINVAVELFKKGLGYKQIERVFQTLAQYTGKKAPSDSVVRQWTLRVGLFKLQTPLPNDEGRWIVIADVVVDVGKMKCLAAVGVNLKALEEREDYTLSFTDLRVLGLHPTTSSNGEFAFQSFQEIDERFENAILEALIIDQGPDLKKGATLLKAAYEKLKVIHDVPHKMSCVLEKYLMANGHWDEYSKQLSQTRNLILQTELAALMPPRQRKKGRFMNVALYLEWPTKVIESKAKGNLKSIPQARYKKYFGWLGKYSISFLDEWHQVNGVAEMIKEITRKHGLSIDSYNYLKETVQIMPINKAISGFVDMAFKSLLEEVEKLDEGQVLPCSTEVLESLFGIFKSHTAKGGHGITGNILTMATLVGPSATMKEIQEAMEKMPVRKMLGWVSNKFEWTMGKLRNKFFKRTKFDSKRLTLNFT